LVDGTGVVEAALVAALKLAAEAKEWGIVGRLADELQARRIHAEASPQSGLEKRFLSPLAQMPRNAEDARCNGPEPLRRRNVFASPNFLSIA
jgi:hypothetical protein